MVGRALTLKWLNPHKRSKQAFLIVRLKSLTNRPIFHRIACAVVVVLVASRCAKTIYKRRRFKAFDVVEQTSRGERLFSAHYWQWYFLQGSKFELKLKRCLKFHCENFTLDPERTSKKDDWLSTGRLFNDVFFLSGDFERFGKERGDADSHNSRMAGSYPKPASWESDYSRSNHTNTVWVK